MTIEELQKRMGKEFIEDLFILDKIGELKNYFACIVLDYTQTNQRYLLRITKDKKLMKTFMDEDFGRNRQKKIETMSEYIEELKKDGATDEADFGPYVKIRQWKLKDGRYIESITKNQTIIEY